MKTAVALTKKPGLFEDFVEATNEDAIVIDCPKGLSRADIDKLVSDACLTKGTAGLRYIGYRVYVTPDPSEGDLWLFSHDVIWSYSAVNRGLDYGVVTVGKTKRAATRNGSGVVTRALSQSAHFKHRTVVAGPKVAATFTKEE